LGGLQRAAVVAASGCSTAFVSGNSNGGYKWMLGQILHKEVHSRFRFYGYDLQDQCVWGASNSFSIRSDEGLIHELRGPNYPNYVMNVGHQLEAGIGAGSARCEGRCFLR